MSRLEDAIDRALRSLGAKPADTASREAKQDYSQKMSAALALAVADELRKRGMKGTRPASPGELDSSGAERRMSGGIGAKKVDVTWATEESGLILGISIKTINFKDRVTSNFQKNLTNRRGDMLIEAVTLHRRFPYAVIAGFFFLDKAAGEDHVRVGGGTPRRRSTFHNAHQRLRLFTGRDDPAGRDEQFERFYVILVEASPSASSVQAYEVGKPDVIVPLDEILTELIGQVAIRNSDFYELNEITGKLVKI